MHSNETEIKKESFLQIKNYKKINVFDIKYDESSCIQINDNKDIKKIANAKVNKINIIIFWCLYMKIFLA